MEFHDSPGSGGCGPCGRGVRGPRRPLPRGRGGGGGHTGTRTPTCRQPGAQRGPNADENRRCRTPPVRLHSPGRGLGGPLGNGRCRNRSPAALSVHIVPEGFHARRHPHCRSQVPRLPRHRSWRGSGPVTQPRAPPVLTWGVTCMEHADRPRRPLALSGRPPRPQGSRAHCSAGRRQAAGFPRRPRRPGVWPEAEAPCPQSRTRLPTAPSSCTSLRSAVFDAPFLSNPGCVCFLKKNSALHTGENSHKKEFKAKSEQCILS